MATSKQLIKSVTTAGISTDILATEITQLIDSARQHVTTTVNASLALLYWQIGRRIQTEVLEDKRADYGQAIVATLSRQLVLRFGKGFTEKSLHRMVQFSLAFADEQIVASLVRHLGWSHFRELIPFKDNFQREFYARMCAVERWSVRTLRERIDSMLYERTAISNKPKETIAADLKVLGDTGRMTPSMVLRDPYVLDFLGLQNSWQERDLESAIIREMEQFLLELGAGFSFMERQKRIQLDGDDFYLDLLFYNRKLKRLVAIELKVGEFKASYKGQMELYLRWLDKFEREEDEAAPLGIILCTSKKSEQIELLELDKSGIHVAQYLTTLPDRALLIQRLQEATERAEQTLQARTDNTPE